MPAEPVGLNSKARSVSLGKLSGSGLGKHPQDMEGATRWFVETAE